MRHSWPETRSSNFNWQKRAERKLVSIYIILVNSVMPKHNSELTSPFAAAALMEQLAALGVDPGD
jgi:septal ring factor EnvC (AmiA/AmiB activator)